MDLIIQMSFSDDLVEIVSGWNQKNESIAFKKRGQRNKESLTFDGKIEGSSQIPRGPKANFTLEKAQLNWKNDDKLEAADDLPTLLLHFLIYHSTSHFSFPTLLQK